MPLLRSGPRYPLALRKSTVVELVFIHQNTSKQKLEPKTIRAPINPDNNSLRLHFKTWCDRYSVGRKRRVLAMVTPFRLFVCQPQTLKWGFRNVV